MRHSIIDYWRRNHQFLNSHVFRLPNINHSILRSKIKKQSIKKGFLAGTLKRKGKKKKERIDIRGEKQQSGCKITVSTFAAVAEYSFLAYAKIYFCGFWDKNKHKILVHAMKWRQKIIRLTESEFRLSFFTHIFGRPVYLQLPGGSPCTCPRKLSCRKSVNLYLQCSWCNNLVTKGVNTIIYSTQLLILI